MTEPTRPQAERLQPDCHYGLTREQVENRIREGFVNGENDIKTKTEKQIILDNILTPFNILNFILATLVILVGSYKNCLFMGVILSNIFIGSFQEIRAKHTIDKLSLIAAPKVKVLREGSAEEISVSDIVLDDILLLSSGMQVCADCILVDGECEVNESLITGESDPIRKKAGDMLLSGSFIVSGNCSAQTEHIGEDNYANKITSNAKYVKKPNSEIMYWVNRIIKWISVIIVPVGVLLFCKQYFISHQTFRQTVIGTVAALVGMIPEGLVLLTSVVLAISVLRLSKHNTLVQELFCIETLARVDTLCLDKTGTITEGTMQMDGLIRLCSAKGSYLDDILAALTNTLEDQSPTFLAIKEKYVHNPNWISQQICPFSSARKWSGASFAGEGTFVMGAAEFILKDRFTGNIRRLTEEYSAKGHRVLLLAHSNEPFCENELPEHLNPLSLILISDKIRKEAPRTLRYFADQGVDIKVISGDNAITVANIAKKAGLENAGRYVDATTLKTPENIEQAARKYSVFGRVTPQQKLELVKALKKDGHTVAMTGDGVNDVLALKESDCSIAMASGSDAARTVSQLVLLDSNFASMPKVVQEGRRSINNLQRSASLFLVKSIFSSIIAVCFIFLSFSYPFQPIQMTLISSLTIGIPSFILGLEPNRERIKGKFIVNVLQKSLPAALTMVLNILILTAISEAMRFTPEQFSTLAVIITGFTGLLMLLRVCSPFNVLRGFLFGIMCIGFILNLLFLPHFYALVSITPSMLLILIPLMILACCAMSAVLHMVDRIILPRMMRKNPEFSSEKPCKHLFHKIPKTQDK